MIEAAVVAILLADSAVSALVKTRVYPMLLPQEQTAQGLRLRREFPAITYQRISNTVARIATGEQGVNTPRVQVDAWALDFDGARALGAAIRAALPDGKRGTFAGEVLRGVFLDSDQDLYDDEVKLFRFRQDFLVSARAAAAA